MDHDNKRCAGAGARWYRAGPDVYYAHRAGVRGDGYPEQHFPADQQKQNAPAVCNRDTGESSTQLIGAINKIGLFKVYLLPKNQDIKLITDSMKQRDALLGVVIPADFTRKVKAKSKSVAGKALTSFGLQADSVKNNAGEIDPLTLYYNPVLQEQLRFSVKGGLQSALQLVESRETLRSLYFSINEKQLPAQLEDEMLNNKATINEVPVSKNGTLSAPNAAQHNVPAWTIFAMFFVIMSLGGSVVREKVSGSFIRLKTLPTNYAVGLLSKQITYVVVTVIQATVIFSLGIWVFPLVGLPALNLPQDVPGLFVVTLVCGWCAVSYAICVGVFAETHQQSNGFGAISIVILAAIGGLMVPSFAMDTSLKSVANFFADALVPAGLLRIVPGRGEVARCIGKPCTFDHHHPGIPADHLFGVEEEKFDLRN